MKKMKLDPLPFYFVGIRGQERSMRDLSSPQK